MLNHSIDRTLTPAGDVPLSLPRRLLVLDDEPNVARVLATFFRHDGWEVTSFQNPREALAGMPDANPDVVLSDLNMPEMTGTEVLQALRARGSSIPLLVITAFGTIDSAVEAMRLGAFDYLTKPFDLERVRLSVQRAYAHRQLQQENAHLRQELQERYRFGSMIGASPSMLEVYAMIQRAARSKANVLLLGESGTGKELAARALHAWSGRSARRFVPVSCAALPQELLESELFGHEKGAFTGANWQRIGRFELADGGTLFLDEIGDISLHVQSKLLRVLQEREIDRVGGSRPIKVDVRLISATHRDLGEVIEAARFREDLYYRLRVVEIRMPPLRERKEDIALLAQHFVDKYAQRDGKPIESLSPETLETLERHNWPGNVRELENTIERAVAMADDDTRVIAPGLLPEHLRGPRPQGTSGESVTMSTPSGSASAPKPLPEALREVERSMVLAALQDANWDLRRAAEALGISLRSLCYSVRKHGLSGPGQS